MRKYFLTMAAGLALTACASSGSGDMTLEEGAQMECRTIYESGTILPKRLCNNKATWAAIEEREKEEAAETINGVKSRQGIIRDVIPKNSGSIG